jgi:hypothetical protein
MSPWKEAAHAEPIDALTSVGAEQEFLMRSKRFYRRRFLNRRGHHAGAYVLSECKVGSWQDRLDLDAFVTIADCGRVVTLDLSGATPAEIGNALFKARTLRDSLVDFTAALEQMADEVRANQASS